MKKCVYFSLLLHSVVNATPVVISTDKVGTVENEEELLEQVFGKKAQKDVLMEFTVLLDGEKVGEAMVLVGKTKKVLAKSMKEVLFEYLLSEEIEKIDKVKDKNGFVTFEDLNFLKLEANFNTNTLQLEIKVPVELKKTRSLGRKNSGQHEKPNVNLANISGFINTRVSQTNYNSIKSYNSRTALLTPAINVFGLVLEGESSYNKNSTEEKGQFKRDYSSLVYDVPGEDLVFRAGDVFSNSIDYQSIPKVWGFGIKKSARTNSLDNFNNSIQVTLLRTSTIETYINNILIKTKNNVAPGTYTLDDIPYSYGSNNVKIRIIDDTGREQNLTSDVFLDSSFLASGEFSYGLTAGYPEINNKKSRYDKENPVISSFIKYGLLSATELSLGLQSNKIGKSYTCGIRDMSFIGIFDLKYAFSNNKTDKVAAKGKVLYASYSSPSIEIFGINTYYGVSVEAADTFFYPYLGNAISSTNNDPTLLQRENTKGRNSNIKYHISFSNIFSTTWSFNYYVRNKVNQNREKAIAINASKYFSFDSDTFSSGYVNCSFEKSRRDGKTNRCLSLSCSLSLKDSFTVSCGYHNAETKSSNFTISESSSDNGFGYNLSINNQNDTKNYNAFTSYNHPRFRANLSHNRTHGTSVSQSTQVGLETTLFFADGAFSIARNSIYDGGFVIVKPTSALENVDIKFLNNSSESGILGGAVLPTQKNSVTSSKLDLKELPDNMKIKQDTIVCEGQYKRGAVAEISCEGSYIAKGTLQDGNGVPMDLVSGYAVHTSDSNADPVQFFTNTAGKFVLTGLKPGKYRVTINVECCNDFEIEIKKTEQNVIELGSVTCEDCDEENTEEN